MSDLAGEREVGGDLLVPEVFDGEVTVFTGGDRASSVLLPVVPA